MLLHQDNAPVHNFTISMAKINELKLELLPSEFFLFPNLKKCLGSRRFVNNEEVKSAEDGYLNKLDSSYYKQCIEAIEHCCEKKSV